MERDRNGRLPMPQLIHNPGGPTQQRYPLQQGLNTLGRSRENAVVLSDSSVSRRHAELELIGRRVLLRDLDSTNHSYLNGDEVDEAELEDGDELRFGDVVLVYWADDPEPPSTSLSADARAGATLVGKVPPARIRELARAVREPGALRRAAGSAGTSETSLLRLPAGAGADDRELAKLRTLLNVSNRLSVPAPLHEVQGRALAQVLELVAVDRVTLLMRDPATARLAPRTFLVRPGRDIAEPFQDHECAESALIKRGPVLTAEAPPGIHSGAEQDQALHVSLCLPLIGDDSDIGALCVDNLSLPAVYSDEDTGFLSELATQIAIALDHARRLDEMLLSARTALP